MGIRSTLEFLFLNPQLLRCIILQGEMRGVHSFVYNQPGLSVRLCPLITFV